MGDTTMMLPFATLDVFTSHPFAGNPVAIVEDADDLSHDQMLTMTKEFNLSETVFVQKPENAKHTAKARIFCPSHEMPFAGHPTIGCAIFLAGKLAPDNSDFEQHITLEEKAGLVPVEVVRKAGLTSARFTAPVAPFRSPVTAPDAATTAAALGLQEQEIAMDDHRVSFHEGGPTFMFAPVASRTALASAKPMEPQWSNMLAHSPMKSVFLFCRDEDDETNKTFHTRMFAPSEGIPEDPATGSATAIFASQLLDAGELSQGSHTFKLMQGEDMGRTSELTLEIDVASSAISAVRVAGSAVPVSEGRVRVPS